MALYLFTLAGGQPAFYVDHGTGYDLTGRPCFQIVGSTACGATGAAIYHIVDEHFTPCESAAWPAVYFNPSDLELETEQLTDSMADQFWVEHLRAMHRR
jgi:hypothetical protein